MNSELQLRIILYLTSQKFSGAWRIIADQEVYFLKTFEIALKKMNKKLRYVSDIMFAYFRQQKCGGVVNGEYLGGESSFI